MKLIITPKPGGISAELILEEGDVATGAEAMASMLNFMVHGSSAPVNMLRKSMALYAEQLLTEGAEPGVLKSLLLMMSKLEYAALQIDTVVAKTAEELDDIAAADNNRRSDRDKRRFGFDPFER